MPVPDIPITIKESHDPKSVVPCLNCRASGYCYEWRKDKQNKVRQYRVECSWCRGTGRIGWRR